MTRPLRYVPAGHMVEITLRTVHGRMLLRPTRVTTNTIAGVVGRAQRRTRMTIHAAIAMSNHMHLLISPEDAEHMARFMSQVGSNIARKVGRQVGWRERFWGRRYRAIVVSNEHQSQIDRLRYLLAHGTKEGFVLDPKGWCGLQSAAALADGSNRIHGTWNDATAAYRDRQAGFERPAESYARQETIHLSPLPCWQDLNPESQSAMVAEIIEDIIHETRKRHQRNETAPTGLQTVLAVDPHEVPRRVKRSPAPRFHASNRNARRVLWEAYTSFVAHYRLAARALRRGDWPVAFPSGCFPPRLPFVTS